MKMTYKSRDQANLYKYKLNSLSSATGIMITLSLQKLSCSSIATSATLLLLLLNNIVQINAAPARVVMNNRIRLLSYESGQFVTVDVKSGIVTASSSDTDAATLFTEETVEVSHLQRFRSINAVDQYLSIVKDDTSVHYAVTPLQKDSSGQSGSSSGSSDDDSMNGSGASELEMDSSSIEIFQNWRVDILNGPYSTIRIPVAENVNCYLAFEYTGEPVADPCSISPDDARASISLEYV